MKNIIFLVFVFFSNFFYAQKYILFSDLEKEYNIKKYTLNTEILHKINSEIEMYNLWDKNPIFFDLKDNITLISLLPNLKEKNLWKKIDLKNIENQILPIQKIKIFLQKEEKIFNQIQIIKQINEEYFVSENCLIEYFHIVDYPSVLRVNDKNVVNLGQNITTYKQIREAYPNKKTIPTENNDEHLEDWFKSIYLSKIEEKNNEKIYHFWLFDDWFKGKYLSHIPPEKEIKENEDYCYHRGIDRFAYIKNKGIVAGSYDFYFDFLPYGYKRIIKNEMMWAKELFP